MIRKAAAVVVVLCLSSASLHAQSTKLTVSASSASVYKSPSVGSPVIGQAQHGAALDVTREVGDWVKVTWPSAPDGVGYVRTNVGALSRGSAAASARSQLAASGTPASARAAAAPAPASRTAATSSPLPSARVEQQPQTRVSAPTPAKVITPPMHTLGLGARMGGSTFGLGASARGWSRSHLGFQLDVSHYSMTSPIEIGSVSATQFGPSVLYGMRDHISDHLWMRPYIGAGADWSHATLSEVTPGFTTTANTLGGKVFVGSEFMFANVPQFALSLDAGYYHMPAPFVGFEPKGFGAAASAHWFIK
jgi:SH3 domain-containing protein